jgi:hypothetical protein
MKWQDKLLHYVEQSNVWMESHDDRLLKIEKAIIRHDENLKEHMRRTELAEHAIEMLTKELKPVRVHVYHVEGALKLVGAVSIILSIIGTIYGLFW